MISPRLTTALLLLLMAFTSCVRRDGRNSDCQWPSSQPGAVQHTLREDLEFR